MDYKPVYNKLETFLWFEPYEATPEPFNMVKFVSEDIVRLVYKLEAFLQYKPRAPSPERFDMTDFVSADILQSTQVALGFNDTWPPRAVHSIYVDLQRKVRRT